MEQFRDDYHTQCIQAILYSAPSLNLFVPASPINKLASSKKWEFGLNLMVSGYGVFPSLTKLSPSQEDEVNRVLRDRTH